MEAHNAHMEHDKVMSLTVSMEGMLKPKSGKDRQTDCRAEI